MFSVSAGLAAHLAGASLTLATCWRVTRRDGLALRLTDHDRDLTVSGDLYSSRLSYERTAIAAAGDLSVDQSEVLAILDSATITERDIRAGLWDGAEVRIFVVNWADLSQGMLRRMRGTLGQVSIRDDGAVRAELRGLAQPLQAPIGNLYQPECRLDLGERKCGIPLRPPLRQAGASYGLGDVIRADVTGGVHGNVYDEGGAIFECIVAGAAGASAPAWNLSAAFTDGGVTWQPRAAWTRPATISAALTSRHLELVADGIEAFADGHFAFGVAIFDVGGNAGVAREVVAWDQSSRVLELLEPPPFAPAPGDVLRVQPGCDGRRVTCRTKFDNADNHRGVTTLPGERVITETPVRA